MPWRFVVCLEGDLHEFERRVPVFCLVIAVREANVGEIDHAAWDVDRLECIDKRLVEAFDVVVVQSADDGGEGRLGLREEFFRILGGSHGSDREGNVPTARATVRERSDERGDRAVVSAIEEVWR